MGRSLNLIPEERVKLETRLVWAIDQVDARPLVGVLKTFPWLEHPELACLSLAEIVRRQPPREGSLVARRVTDYCLSACGHYCRDCPVREARQAA